MALPSLRRFFQKAARGVQARKQPGHHFSQPDIIITGGGVQALATGIALQELGHRVTILEAAKELQQGSSWRPRTFNNYALGHSGALAPAGSKRAMACIELYGMLNRPPAHDSGTVHELRRASVKTGKILVARDEADLAKLDELEQVLKESGVPYERITDPNKIDAFRDDMVNSKNTAAVLFLPNSVLININTYINGLRDRFVANGGAMKMGHKVTGFVPPSLATQKNGTGVICTDANGKKTILYADTIVNRAGIQTGAIAEMAHKALQESIDRKLGAKTPPPETPRTMYSNLFVWVPKPGTDIDLRTTTIAYFAKNAVVKDDPSKGLVSGVGMHVYPSVRQQDGTFTITIGPINGRTDNMVEVGLRGATPIPAITQKMIDDAKVVYPEFDPDKWELKPVGSTVRVFDPVTNERDLVITQCADAETGMRVWNCFTSDGIGITLSIPTAHDVANRVHQDIAKRRNKAPIPVAARMQRRAASVTPPAHMSAFQRRRVRAQHAM